MIGFDYTARIAPAALKAAGAGLVIRYITPQTSAWPKSLTTAEAHELLAAGIPIVANYETTADRMLGAAAAGHDDALAALANLAALGAPGGLRVWFSADWDVQPTQVIDVLDYLHAAADVLGGQQYVGLYGVYRAVGAAADAGFAIWQTAAWSGGRWDPRCAARQGGSQTVGGVQVDVDQILIPGAMGAWTPASSGGSTMPNIPPSIGQMYPEIADQFPANAAYTDETALIWADGGARAAAFYARQARDAVNALAAKVSAPPAVDVNALAAALAPQLAAGASADAVAAAVVEHLAGQLAKP